MKTVLVVDDYASVRFYHMTLLRSAGYTPLAATGGAEALALLDRQSVDLVMLDLVMPSMSGREVVQRIRALPRYVGLPILVITSEADHPELAGIKTDPACRVMTKPILPTVLLQEVHRLIG
jgi:two-component system chemotaxis response regulator CheY